MVRIRNSLVIGRPPDVVFDTVADQRNDPRYNTAKTPCLMTTDHPIGVGTRFESTMATRGKPITMTSEYTGYDRARLLSALCLKATAPRWVGTGISASLPEN